MKIRLGDLFLPSIEAFWLEKNPGKFDCPILALIDFAHNKAACKWMAP